MFNVNVMLKKGVNKADKMIRNTITTNLSRLKRNVVYSLTIKVIDDYYYPQYQDVDIFCII